MGVLHGPMLYYDDLDALIENYVNGVLKTRICHRTPVALSPPIIVNQRKHNTVIDSDSDDSGDDGSDDDRICRSPTYYTADTIPRSTSPSPRDAASTETSPRVEEPRCKVTTADDDEQIAKDLNLVHKRIMHLRLG
jgi:hypothetical protein